jgi:hypothetical protein
MKLSEFVKEGGRGTKARLSRASGLSWATVHACCKGELIKLYETAKRLSAATDGAVSVAELCEAAVAPVPVTKSA